MTDDKLGRLQRIEVREIWTTEAGHFTPWLARAENLAVLSETLGLQLEFEAQEKPVGPFRADILCKEIVTDRWVLIENQLERTDHTHLGQLLTYASGLDAATIVWVAARFTEEHRSTLDWLNRITDDSFRFFGLEVELWRIGDSLAAPKFNIVSKPNDWSHAVAQAARAISEGQLSETQVMQLEYWTALNAALSAARGPVEGRRKPQPRSWINYAIGRNRFTLAASMNRQKKSVMAELYLGGTNAKAHFSELEADKEKVHQELGYELNWELLPEGQDCRIASQLRDADIDDETDWPRQHSWLAQRLNDLHRAFCVRVRELGVGTADGTV